MEWIALAVAVAAVAYAHGTRRRADALAAEVAAGRAQLEHQVRRLLDLHLKEEHDGAPTNEERARQTITEAREEALRAASITSSRPSS